MPKVFLKAAWNNLVMANYEVDPAILAPYLPKHTELDLFEGKCYVSLVAFMFNNTKVLGMKIPFHVNFEEVNLRFYVKHNANGENRRGVVFIKEIVSKPAISFIANTLYNENYETMKTAYYHSTENDNTRYTYLWGKDKSNLNSISFLTSEKKNPLQKGSKEEFITEHYWGYAGDENETTEYAVQHPSWNILEYIDHAIDCDFSEVYGAEWAFLKNQKPSSVFMAEGSDIVVCKGKTIV